MDDLWFRYGTLCVLRIGRWSVGYLVRITKTPNKRENRFESVRKPYCDERISTGVIMVLPSLATSIFYRLTIYG